MLNFKFVFITCVLINIVLAGIDSNRVFLVDNYEQNLLFRTNLPVQDGKFQYDELVEIMKQKTTDAGLQFPDKFYMKDYTLLNDFSYTKIQVEKQFFKKNPDLGELIQYPVIGSILFPNQLNKNYVNFMSMTYEHWNFDNLNLVNQQLVKDLKDTSGIPQIIFFHCTAGEDRTGQVFGGYKMQVQNWSYKRALVFDNHVETREIQVQARNGMNWFCYYLQNYHKMQNLECEYMYNPDDKPW